MGEQILASSLAPAQEGSCWPWLCCGLCAREQGFCTKDSNPLPHLLLRLDLGLKCHSAPVTGSSLQPKLKPRVGWERSMISWLSWSPERKAQALQGGWIENGPRPRLLPSFPSLPKLWALPPRQGPGEALVASSLSSVTVTAPTRIFSSHSSF